MPSVLWRCWLGGRKGIRPVKTEDGVLAWLSAWSEVQTCTWAQLMPLPLTVSCFSKIQIDLPFLVPAHLGSPGKRAVKRVCVSVLLAPLTSLGLSSPFFSLHSVSFFLSIPMFVVSFAFLFSSPHTSPPLFCTFSLLFPTYFCWFEQLLPLLQNFKVLQWIGLFWAISVAAWCLY